MGWAEAGCWRGLPTLVSSKQAAGEQQERADGLATAGRLPWSRASSSPRLSFLLPSDGLFLFVRLLIPAPGSVGRDNPLQIKLLFPTLAPNPAISVAPLDPAG